MAVCFLAAEEGKIKLDRKVALKSSDKFSGSGILKDTRIGTTFTVEELIGLMIYDSDNTATNMLTNMVGIDYLNNAFNTFGLKNTKLSRKVAEFSLRDRGIENYTTAEDMTLILEKMYRRVLVNENVSDKCLKLLKLQRINDRIPKYLPVDVTVAHKTGLESSVCHDAGIVFTCKGNFLIVILTKHANSDSALSKEFIAKAAMYVYKYFEKL
jgi:beta-lactamase class A